MNTHTCHCSIAFAACETGIHRRAIIRALYHLLQHPGFVYLPQTAKDATWARYEYHREIYFAHMREHSTRAHELPPKQR